MLMEPIISKTAPDLVLLCRSKAGETPAVFVADLSGTNAISENFANVYDDVARHCFPPAVSVVYREQDGSWCELLSPADRDNPYKEYRREWLDERPEDTDVDRAIGEYEAVKCKRAPPCADLREGS